MYKIMNKGDNCPKDIENSSVLIEESILELECDNGLCSEP